MTARGKKCMVARQGDGISLRTIPDEGIPKSSHSGVIEESLRNSRFWVSCIVYKLVFFHNAPRRIPEAKIVLLVRKFVLKCAASNTPLGQFSSLVLTR